MNTLPAPPANTEERTTRAATARASGFSLVEVLVTLSITALASAMIVATARPADPLRTEGERLSHMVEQLEARARISGQPMGLRLAPDGYTSMGWKNGEWISLSRQPYALTGGVELRVPANMPQGSMAAADTATAPHVVLDPLGHSGIEPIVLELNGRSFVIDPASDSAGDGR